MTFYVGQKVVCIYDGVGRFSGQRSETRKGSVYTIVGITKWFGMLALHFDEAQPASGCFGFDAARFRPVVERKTDISALQALLNPSREQVSA